MNDSEKILSRIEQFELHAQSQQTRSEYTQVTEATKTLGNRINSSDKNLVRTAVTSELNHTHRFLQNKLIIELLQGLGDLGKLFDDNPSMWSDQRNQFAMKLCSKLHKTFKDELFGD